ncbi:hypothetical protein Nwat_2715 [Nitrosococcus watsonii C-113]|uniref:Uncharacterized protein n=1 Tax=Nitrosococcus watsoni (strain C-113) TaxID=105559 RepID=D8KAQ4_NITWC|nr:hypothetical protein Nwat_2715 [Nitrosococcus watsonii C-113]
MIPGFKLANPTIWCAYLLTLAPTENDFSATFQSRPVMLVVRAAVRRESGS